MLAIVLGGTVRGAGDTTFPLVWTLVCAWGLMVVPTAAVVWWEPLTGASLPERDGVVWAWWAAGGVHRGVRDGAGGAVRGGQMAVDDGAGAGGGSDHGCRCVSPAGSGWPRAAAAAYTPGGPTSPPSRPDFMDRPPLLFRVLHAEKAKGTHHKLALDALLHLRGDHAERWRNLFLRHVEPFLKGSKAPDKEFKDFTNHVLHVRDGLWGGAPKKAREWYAALVDALTAKDWPAAAFSAGVLSHYYSDPLMPFHTAQSDKEKVIHRAGEWSCSKSYDEFHMLLADSLGWPDVPVPSGEDWVEKMVVAGAVRSHGFYDELCDRYDHDAGVKNPPAGLDERCREELAVLVGHAAVGFSRMLDRAFEEAGKAGVTPPRYGVSVVGFLTAFTKPILWLTRKLHDAADRREVLAIWKELQKTGAVEKSLPAEQRAVRAVKAEAAKPAEAAPAPAPNKPARPRMIAAVPAAAPGVVETAPRRAAGGAPRRPPGRRHRAAGTHRARA